MGFPPSSDPDKYVGSGRSEAARGSPSPLLPEVTYGAPYRLGPSPRRRWWHLALFLLTVASTMLVGADHFASFSADFGSRRLDWSTTELLLNGLWYSASILAILGAHEFGHYYACRYYGVDASLPYFLPAPLPLTGTTAERRRTRDWETRRSPCGPIRRYSEVLCQA